jgi:hypothetical protein
MELTPVHIPVYIAAPFAARHTTSVVENIRRACTMARLAFQAGLVPVLVHLDVDRGIYGQDEDATEREAGLAATRDIAGIVGKAGGSLWILFTDEGTLSAGCGGELLEFAKSRQDAGYSVAQTEKSITFFRWEGGEPVRVEDNLDMHVAEGESPREPIEETR